MTKKKLTSTEMKDLSLNNIELFSDEYKLKTTGSFKHTRHISNSEYFVKSLIFHLFLSKHCLVFISDVFNILSGIN